MGTSTRNSGQSGHTPLVPSWLDEDSNENVAPLIADPNRFRTSRGDFTTYTNGRGLQGSTLRRSVSRYVKDSVGGSSNAVKRLGSSRTSTGKLYGIINAFSGGGVAEVERYLSTNNLSGLSAGEFFVRIADYVCPDGGPNNEGIARAAYYETIAEITDLIDKPIESLSPDDLEKILQSYMSKVVIQNIMNDIGNKVILLPDELSDIRFIEDNVKKMVKQSVSDACANLKREHGRLTDKKSQEITDKIYKDTYSILEGLGE